MTKTFGAVRQKRIESIARPGETWEQAEARLREKKSSLSGENKTTSSIRNPPASDAQRDFFVPTLYDVGTKDNRSIMDVAVFRLSKKDKRIGEVINYTLPDGHVTVSAGAAGMASVWDYDLVLMAISHLTEAMNRHREGKGVKPGRVFQPHIADVLRFCRRADGGKQKEDILDTCIRLNTTHVAVHRIKKSQNGQAETVDEGEALISRYKVIKSNTGKPVALEIELSDWMYREITEGKNPDVLTVHPDYFLIDPGIGRFIYRLARRAAGKREARWSFQTIYEHSGSTGTIKKFTENLRKIIAANDLPEYNLRQEKGLNGPILVMTYRTLIEGQTTKSP